MLVLLVPIAAHLLLLDDLEILVRGAWHRRLRKRKPSLTLHSSRHEHGREEISDQRFSGKKTVASG